MNIARKTKAALEKYGIETCEKAFEFNCQGEGASTIGIYLGLKTNQADAAINAGRELKRSRENALVKCGIFPNL